MGKKLKVGKARKDKFYHLAKETGYRARSSFKLLQLNRKFDFLQKARVCIDLCAAPGGWLQVASECMPMSSVIIGVDLVPIKPVPKCSTFQEDITTDKCRQVIKKELQTWKADVVLHDGAPNVGKNWVHDAFAQAELTLSALKLATGFLRKGGWFVTKVFRSKDYQTLIWVFGQMFKKVHATKPKASRNESAEIFVVCQGYLAPDKIDPKFLDPRDVFKDISGDAKPTINLIHPEKVKKNAEGYADGAHVLFNKVSAMEFIKAENHLEVLASASELVFNNDAVRKHPLTTTEIQECCKDIRVLGKRELRDILTWRKKMVDILDKMAESRSKKEEESKVEKPKSKSTKKSSANGLAEVEEVDMDASDESSEGDSSSGESDLDNEDEEKVKEQLSDLKDEERRVAKRKRKKVMREKRKLRDKMSLNMVIPGDHLDITDDISLFDLKKIKNKQQLTDVEKNQMSDHESEPEEDDSLSHRRKHLVAYDRHGKQLLDQDDYDSEDQGSEDNNDMEFEEEEDSAPVPAHTGDNPLVVEMETKEVKARNKMDLWFKKAGFEGLEEEADEDIEIEKMTEDLQERGGQIIGKSSKSEKKKDKKKAKNEKVESDEEMDGELSSFADLSESRAQLADSSDSGDEDEESDSDSDSDSDSESDYEMYNGRKSKKSSVEKDSQNKTNKDGFEIVSEATAASRKFTRLDPVELALGEEMIKSSKRRRELIDDSYNRYTYGDEGNLPDWFVKDEAKHSKRQLPISKSQVEKYKERLKAINARPIKKIAEAEARKKKRMMRKMDRARQRAEKITESEDVSNKEKMKAIKDVYKRAGLLKKKKEEVSYVVAKRGTGRKVSRPPGIKGRFKVVDPRMKKDIQKQKIRDKKSKKKGKGAKRGGGKR